MSLTDIMSHANYTVFAELALVIFAVTFSAIVIHTWRRPRAEVSRMAALALDRDAAIAAEGAATAAKGAQP
jgi:hypothetical protein